MRSADNRVLVGMSGGIDSSAVCLMLQEQGYEIVGVTMRVWGDEPAGARELADRIGIAHYVADEREPFRRTVVRNFVDEYRRGRTPNPCVMCNPLFKFRVLTEWADKLGCRWIATGHYSQLAETNHRIYIVAGEDEKKDQSYSLWRLGQETLRRTLFPLGTYTKDNVRDYLRSKGFEAKASGGESMEVCFIQGDYRDFLREQYPALDEEIGPGWFVNRAGVKLGQHKGYPYYTIGQRKGLEIALGKPAYVLRINPDKNTVMLGDAQDLCISRMLAEDPQIIREEELFSCPRLAVRIRYRSRPIPCQVSRLDDGRLLVHFKEEASAVTPGQSAVFYDGNRVLGARLLLPRKESGDLRFDDLRLDRRTKEQIRPSDIIYLYVSSLFSLYVLMVFCLIKRYVAEIQGHLRFESHV